MQKSTTCDITKYCRIHAFFGFEAGLSARLESIASRTDRALAPFAKESVVGVRSSSRWIQMITRTSSLREKSSTKNRLRKYYYCAAGICPNVIALVFLPLFFFLSCLRTGRCLTLCGRCSRASKMKTSASLRADLIVVHFPTYLLALRSCETPSLLVCNGRTSKSA